VVENLPEDIRSIESPFSVLRKSAGVGNLVANVEIKKPPVCKVNLNFPNKLPFTSYSVQIPDE
jgi:hypothetical protein